MCLTAQTSIVRSSVNTVDLDSPFQDSKLAKASSPPPVTPEQKKKDAESNPHATRSQLKASSYLNEALASLDEDDGDDWG